MSVLFYDYVIDSDDDISHNFEKRKRKRNPNLLNYINWANLRAKNYKRNAYLVLTACKKLITNETNGLALNLKRKDR